MIHELLVGVCTTIPSDAAVILPAKRLALCKERVARRTEARSFETLLAVPAAEEELQPRLTLLLLDAGRDATIAENVDGAGRPRRLEAECREDGPEVGQATARLERLWRTPLLLRSSFGVYGFHVAGLLRSQSRRRTGRLPLSNLEQEICWQV